jgi:hypothetical protein
MEMIPYHEVRDYEHMKKLMASMEANGWVGAPLVIWDDEYLITGSHRYAAAMELGWDESEIPTIELAEVFAEAGLDFEQLHAEYGYPTIDEHGMLVALLNELPEEIREKYGIDLH